MLRGPPLNSRQGRWIWTGMVLVYWSLAFVIGSAIPQVQTISGLVAAVCIMQVRASASPSRPYSTATVHVHVPAPARVGVPAPARPYDRAVRADARVQVGELCAVPRRARDGVPRHVRLRDRDRGDVRDEPGDELRVRAARLRRVCVCVGGRWMVDVCALVVLVSCMLFTFNAVYLPLGQSTVCDRPWPC
jgi:hypothetical protein